MKTISYDPEQGDKLDQLIQSAFSEAVRKQRRNLLLVSTVSLFITTADVIPSGASVFGISFSDVSPHAVLVFLFLLTLYFGLEFWLYAWSEYRSARRTKEDQESKRLVLAANYSLWREGMQNRLSRARYRLWLALEYYLPIIVGGLALVSVGWEFATS